MADRIQGGGTPGLTQATDIGPADIEHLQTGSVKPEDLVPSPASPLAETKQLVSVGQTSTSSDLARLQPPGNQFPGSVTIRHIGNLLERNKQPVTEETAFSSQALQIVAKMGDVLTPVRANLLQVQNALSQGVRS